MYDVEHNNIPTYVHNEFVQYRNPVFDGRLRNRRTYNLPRNMSQNLTKSTIIPSSIRHWSSLPIDVQTRYSQNSFKYHLRLFIGRNQMSMATPKLNLPRQAEIVLNRTRCDLIFKNTCFLITL